ncbi:MAG TPA: hypothetical protein VGR67_02245 [Candidatus Polarisedimenticolia bacterium]|jgi:hypothetical protein|nr:hypothetical protein [Candidatus Polarisedimenticolia bacterium]
MLFRDRPHRSVLLIPLLIFLSACGGKGSTHHSSPPRSNVDLAISEANFTVSPAAADADDPITISGTIQNVGSETANEMLGDSFRIRFNLSTDGTWELNEVGFLEQIITAPIPPGGSLDFTYTGPYGGGETLNRFSDFCNSTNPDCPQPQFGVIGAKVDGAEEINEVEEGNNFAFKPIQVVGTVVAATFRGCDFGLPGDYGAAPGCDLSITDGLTTYTQHQPCVNCGDATQIVFPNEIRREIVVSVTIRDCSLPLQCGGSWEIIAATSKPGLPVSTKNALVSAGAPSGGDGATVAHIEIRDPNY